jgi:hypothetical protein
MKAWRLPVHRSINYSGKTPGKRNVRQVFRNEKIGNKVENTNRRIGSKVQLHSTHLSVIKLNYFKAFDTITTMQLHLHGTLDLAIIEFQGFKEKVYSFTPICVGPRIW